MRATWLATGLVLVAACGGGEKKAETPAAAPAAASTAAPAAAPATNAPVHVVEMTLDGTTPKYSPSELTIKQGDIVRFINKQGGPHNVSFWPDSIPAGAQAVLNTAMTDQMAPLQSQLLVDADKTYDISFAGAPEGVYKFYCLPHLAMGMHGKITVTK
ncbi:MAG TPA: plastocyanin/azurin family copper-binding protein [Gemmatimonadales bacterium]|nr:plastocyanin/azurin family copper-binding protein [Gemmatimonadales bacterium]